MKQINNLGKFCIAFFLSLVFIPSVFSWCILGVGNTCGSQSTDSSNDGFVSKYVFNFDSAKSSSTTCFLGFCPGKTQSSMFKSSDNRVSDETDSVSEVTDDNGGSYQIKTTKTSSTKVSTARGEIAPALFYDVDVLNAEFNCLNCPVINGKVVNSAGFNYQLDIDLINDGNVETEEPIGLEITIETPEGVKTISFDRNALYLPAGSFELSIPIDSFGVENGNLKEEYILGLTSDVKEIPIEVNIKIFDDYGVSEARVQQITSTKRICSGTGMNRVCEDQVTYEEKKSCPDGSDYAGLHGCENPKGIQGNSLEREFEIVRVSPDVTGASKFNFN